MIEFTEKAVQRVTTIMKEQKVPNKKSMLQMILGVENLSPQFQLLPAYQNMFEW